MFTFPIFPTVKALIFSMVTWCQISFKPCRYYLSKIERFYPWIYWFIFLSPRNCLSRRPIMLGNRLTLQFLCALLLILATFVCDSDGVWTMRYGRSIAKKRTFPYRDIATLLAREQLRSYNEWERPALNARNMESERYVLLSTPEKSRWVCLSHKQINSV